jgi:MFS transporter, OPA family, sugar phosphate sensor protein UhpC
MLANKLHGLAEISLWRWQYLLVLPLTALSYVVLIFNSSALSVASPAMVEDSNLSLTTKNIGEILGLGSFASLFGKLFSGVLSDYVKRGNILFTISVLGVASMSFIFSFGSSKSYFLGVFFVLKLFHSLSWPSMTHIVARWYPEECYGFVWGVIGFCSRLGNLNANLILGSLLFLFDWRWIFRISGILGWFFVVLCSLFLPFQPSGLGFSAILSPYDTFEEDGEVLESEPPPPGEADEKIEEETNFESTETDDEGCCWMLPIVLKIARDPLCLCMAFAHFCGAWAFEFGVTLVPLFIYENFDVSVELAGILGAVYPLGCAAGVLTGGWLYDRCAPKQAITLISSSIFIALIFAMAIWALLLFPSLFSSTLRTVLVCILLTGNAFFLVTMYYIPISVYSLQFGGNIRGMVVSFLDVPGYLGAMIMDLAGTSYIDNNGWTLFWPRFVISAHIAAFIGHTVYHVLRMKRIEGTQTQIIVP